MNLRVWIQFFKFFSGQPNLLGFSKTHILDLLTLLFHPAKVPLIGFEILLKSCLAYCDYISIQKNISIVMARQMILYQSGTK